MHQRLRREVKFLNGFVESVKLSTQVLDIKFFQEIIVTFNKKKYLPNTKLDWYLLAVINKNVPSGASGLKPLIVGLPASAQ